MGLNTAYDWVVVEAKGRTNEYEDTVLKSAKMQTQQLTTIQGSQPVLRVASLAYFSKGTLRFAMRDPRGESGRGKIDDLSLTKDELLRAYYRPLQVWFQEATGVETVTIADRRYRLIALSDFDLSIGLPYELEEQLHLLEPGKEQHPSEDNMFIGTDGLLIRLGSVWTSEKMRLEPQARLQT